MRQRTVITLLLCLLTIACAVGAVYLYHAAHHNVSSIYLHYKKTPGVKASYVPSFAINDSVNVDVTLLQATDTAAWQTLKQDFQIRELPQELMQHVQNGNDIVCTQTSPFSQGHEVVAVSYKMMEISILHAKNRQQEYAILYHNIKKTAPQQ